VSLGKDSEHFYSVPELVHYYSKNRLPIKGAEHIALLFPLLEQLL
jgi:hypothetical protein